MKKHGSLPPSSPSRTPRQMRSGQSGAHADGRGARRRHSLALQIYYGERPIIRISEWVYQVPSQTTSDYYTTNLLRKTCACPDWRKRRRICKHIEVAGMAKASYSGSPFTPTSQPNPHRNPPHYDRLRRTRGLCLRAMLSCVEKGLPTDAAA